jgi:NAD(P)-dependent dehydrogenase (short-subunit alcohol dehydrogenase family)
VTRLFEETVKAFGTLDILVNNAVFQQFLTIEQVSEATFHKHFNVNALGLVLTIQASLKLFGNKVAILSISVPAQAKYHFRRPRCILQAKRH